MTKVSIEIEPWVEAVIDRALARHVNDCPLHERVRKIELSWAKVLGMVIGGGAVGGFVAKIVGIA